jgi:hypothetical protein
MATGALIVGLRGGGSGGDTGINLTGTVYFYDFLAVDNPDADGTAYYVDVSLSVGWSLADLKTALVAAVLQRATDAGITPPLSTNVTLPTYERGV